MADSFNFDEIRPYNDTELTPVLKRLVNDPSFLQFVSYLFPDWTDNTLSGKIEDIDSIHTFQKTIMYPAAKKVVERTIDQLSYTGFEKIDPDKSYLFLSNHRDIILDSALLNLILFEHELDTVEVAIGSNLLLSTWITDLVKLNKNFVVHRNVPNSQLYQYSKRLSTYIRQKIVERESSVWIAQKQGRTKDGNDKTQASLLKMFTISSEKFLTENLHELNIATLSISYEYEPCDILKAYELYMLSVDSNFKKSPEDDLNSMFFGVTGYKGRVHLGIGETLDPAVLKEISKITNKNEQLKTLALHFDQQIYRNYKLWPTNYIAADLLHKSDKYSTFYTAEEKDTFLNHISSKLEKYPGHSEPLKKLLLTIYANAVYNKDQSLASNS